MTSHRNDEDDDDDEAGTNGDGLYVSEVELSIQLALPHSLVAILGEVVLDILFR